MLKNLRQSLVLLLFALLPFHALLVTAGTKLILGAGHAPLVWIAIWKEVVIGVIFVAGICELGTGVIENWKLKIENFRSLFRGNARIRWDVDLPTILILFLLALAFGIQFHNFQFSIFNSQLLFGFKYLFIPLIFFLLLKNLPWDEDFLERRLFPVLLTVGGIVALYGIASFFLPMSFFTAFGYSDAHSLYAPGSSLSAFQQIGESGIRRVQATFAGPNQFGIWLLIPLSIALVWCIGKIRNIKNRHPLPPQREGVGGGFVVLMTPGSHSPQTLSPPSPSAEWEGVFVSVANFVLFFAVSTTIVLTFSRSAWIAALLIALIAIGMMLRRRSRIIALTSLAGSSLAACLLILLIAPNLILRGLSNRHHLERVREGVAVMLAHPLGLGLGSAGPAQNHVSDPCLYFDAGADISWAADRSDLCLFVSGTQIQPPVSVKKCDCPFLPENWYVQVGVELGIAGALLFIVLVLWNIVTLLHCYIVQKSVGALGVFLAFFGVSIAALFLHAWEDSAVAYTVWGLIGIMLAAGRRNVLYSPYNVSQEEHERQDRR